MIAVKVTGATETASMLEAVQTRIADMTPAFEVIGMNLQRRVARRFQSGNGWPQSIRAMREGGRTMLLTNRLRNSIGTLGGDGGVYDVTRSSVVIGTNTVYARLLQEGGTVTAKKGKYLAIPVSKKARRAAATVPTIRDIPNLVWIPGAEGGVLGKKIGGDIDKYKGDRKKVTYGEGKRAGSGKRVKGFFEPWFVLRKSVTIPARPYLYIEDDEILSMERVILRHIRGNEKEGGE